MKRLPLEERFWAKVDRGGPVIRAELGPCWVWKASGQRYGKIRNHGAYVSAHHVSWLITNGAIPDGLWVLHKCDNPKCVRPDHLWLGTGSDHAYPVDTQEPNAIVDYHVDRRFKS
ncbi:MAG: HNH endonuclease signature motif containing protein [Bryobacteraceae bacterium]